MPDWAEIIEREGGAVWRTAYRLLGDRADADECFQEAFLAALEVARRQPVRDWGALLRHLASSRAIDRLRRRYRRGTRPPVVDWEALPCPTPEPSRAAEDAELSESLRAALAALPSRQAEVFCLHYLEDLSYREVADHLGISIVSVGVLLHRARPSVASGPGNVVRGPARGGTRPGPDRGPDRSHRGVPMSPSPPVPPSDHDDPVARAADALRRTPVPDGPPPETIDRTLAALRAAAEEPAGIPRTRRNLMFTLLKTAAAIVVAAAGATYFAAFPPAAARSEFNEVAAKLRDAQTLSLRHTQTMTIAGKAETGTARLLYKVPGLVRTETELPGASVTIFDTIRNKILILNPADRSAMLLEQPPAQGGGPGPEARRRGHDDRGPAPARR